ncbi:MAG: hypothetical protein GYA62_06720 [Bacteroidales bacterium]|nr:hypothetical protein [Bacteroidales bacterium]
MLNKIQQYLFLGLTFSAFSGITLSTDSDLSLFKLFIISLGFISFFLKPQYDIYLSFFKYFRIGCILFVVVIVFTMIVRGSGLKILGSELWGGSTYIILIFSCILVINSHKLNISAENIRIGIVLLLLGGIIPFINELLIYFGFGRIAFVGSVIDDTTVINPTTRLQTGGPLSLNLLAFSFLLYNKNQYNRIIISALFLISLIIGGLSGHRLALIGFVMFLIFYFYFKQKTKKIFFYSLPVVIILILLLPIYVELLPLPFQRMIAFIPGINVNYLVLNDALGSTEWRLKIWDYIFADINKYLLVGKGLTFSSHEFYLASQSSSDGIFTAFLVGNYHNGPLSFLMVFGIAGIIALFLMSIFYFKLLSNLKTLIINHRLSNDIIVLSAYNITNFLTFLLFYGDLNKMMPLLFIQFILLISLLRNDLRKNV